VRRDPPRIEQLCDERQCHRQHDAYPVHCGWFVPRMRVARRSRSAGAIEVSEQPFVGPVNSTAEMSEALSNHPPIGHRDTVHAADPHSRFLGASVVKDDQIGSVAEHLVAVCADGRRDFTEPQPEARSPMERAQARTPLSSIDPLP
jgi:hypothetical protein